MNDSIQLSLSKVRFFLRHILSASSLSRLNVLDTPVLLWRASVNVLNFISIVRVLDLLCARCRGERVLDAASHNVAFKQNVDRLERDALGLGHAEDGVDTHDDAGTSEQKEGTVRDIGEHNLLRMVRITSSMVQGRLTGVILAITKLKSHWVISAAAMMRERTWLGAHSDARTKGMGPQPNE